MWAHAETQAVIGQCDHKWENTAPGVEWCVKCGLHRTKQLIQEKPPLASGLLDYFPDALAAVAEVSRVGSLQHHPDKPMHWDRDKPANHADSLMRHMWNRGSIDTDGQAHSAKVAWRALAMLQLEIEEDQDGRAP